MSRWWEGGMEGCSRGGGEVTQLIPQSGFHPVSPLLYLWHMHLSFFHFGNLSENCFAGMIKLKLTASFKVESVALFVAACKHKLVPSSWAKHHQKYQSVYLYCFNGEVDNLAGLQANCLSDRKQANSVSLFIPSLFFSAQKQVKAKPKVTLVLGWALSACRFAS